VAIVKEEGIKLQPVEPRKKWKRLVLLRKEEKLEVESSGKYIFNMGPREKQEMRVQAQKKNNKQC
jgi:hypothetical protein